MEENTKGNYCSSVHEVILVKIDSINEQLEKLASAEKENTEARIGIKSIINFLAYLNVGGIVGGALLYLFK